jgi:hypothetical protein
MATPQGHLISIETRGNSARCDPTRHHYSSAPAGSRRGASRSSWRSINSNRESLGARAIPPEPARNPTASATIPPTMAPLVSMSPSAAYAVQSASTAQKLDDRDDAVCSRFFDFQIPIAGAPNDAQSRRRRRLDCGGADRRALGVMAGDEDIRPDFAEAFRRGRFVQPHVNVAPHRVACGHALLQFTFIARILAG